MSATRSRGYPTASLDMISLAWSATRIQFEIGFLGVVFHQQQRQWFGLGIDRGELTVVGDLENQATLGLFELDVDHRAAGARRSYRERVFTDFIKSLSL